MICFSKLFNNRSISKNIVLTPIAFISLLSAILLSAYRGNQAFAIHHQKQMVINDVDSITKYDKLKPKYILRILGQEVIYYPFFSTMSSWKGEIIDDLGVALDLKEIFSEPLRKDLSMIGIIDKDYLDSFESSDQNPFWLFIIIRNGKILDDNLLKIVNKFSFSFKKNINYSIYWREFTNES